MTENIEEDNQDIQEEDYEEKTEVIHFKKRRASLKRPADYKLMSQFNPQKFKKKKSLIAKRLSQKQRMGFNELVTRGIHAGLDDELYERRVMDKSKKMLQLNRRLSHRPQPNEIIDDDELPLDLKKADTEYYKLYHYRDANDDQEESESESVDDKYVKTNNISRAHRTLSDPLPPPNMNRKIQSRSIENPLDWKFGQRSSSNDLIIRGIIPEQYAAVIHGNKSLEEAKKEFEAYRKSSTIQVAKRLDLKIRPTRKDLQDRGIVPDWENPNILQENKEKNTQALAMKYGQRMDPDEADQRAIINKEQLLSNKDYEEYRKEKKEENKKLKLRMSNSLNQRSDRDDVIFRGIVQREYLDQDANVAKQQLREQRSSIKAQMSSAIKARPSKEAMTKLYLKTSESDPLQPQPKEVDRNQLKIKDDDSPYAEYNGILPTTPEYDEIANYVHDDDADDYDFPTFLDRLKAEKKETKQLLKKHMKRRSTVEELQKQGILPMNVPFGGGYDGDASNVDEEDEEEEFEEDDDDDGEFVSFLDRMKNERKEHRKSIQAAHKRRPTVEELEERGILVAGEHDYGPNVQDVYMSNEYANALNKKDDNEESSSDDSTDAFPTFLDRMREEKEQTIRSLEMKHRRRPSQQDLEERGIVAKGYFDNMQVALNNKKERRQSFTTELASFFTQRPDIAQMLTKGLVAAEFIGMDSVEIKEKRKAIKAKLNRKLNKKRRPTMDDLEMRGIVPCGYFSDAQQAVSKKHTRRLTAEKDLASFLPKRLNPQFMLQKGFIPQQQFETIMGSQATTMNKEQQAFSNGAMGVAGIYSQKLVKETLKENKDDRQQTSNNNNNNKRRNSKRISSGIGNIVLDVPQHAERNLFNHDNWTQNLYESLMNSLRFTQIIKRIETAKTNENMDALSTIVEKYEAFQRLHHTKMNGLQRDKKTILDEIEECDVKEKESVEILQNLIIEHSSLEQKIRPQMKMLLHKMTLVETRIMNTKNEQLLAEYKQELNYYDTYCTELKNVFIMTNNIRSKYQNSIRTVMKHRDELDIKLSAKEKDIVIAKKELKHKFKEFHEWISEVSDDKAHAGNDDNDTIEESKYDPLASDPITDLKAVLDTKTKSIDTNLDLLSFRISTIPATDYALRVIELCQLSYIYSSDHLKSFFEWFIRFAVQTFVEITYAHTCFTTQNKNAVDNEINQLKSIQFITELIPDQALFDGLTVIVSYLELLPSNNDDDATSNNNVDHEYVIFHVARYLTAHFTFSQSIISQKEEGDIPGIAQQKVNEWISVILQSSNSHFDFSKDFNQITNKENRSRNIIKATKQDSTARVRPARAAAIVMDHVYGIYVDG